MSKIFDSAKQIGDMITFTLIVKSMTAAFGDKCFVLYQRNLLSLHIVLRMPFIQRFNITIVYITVHTQ